MPYKLDKFGIKFWLSLDIVTKYLLSRFPYLGKDETAIPELHLSENILLTESHLNKGRNITRDNYFTKIKSDKILKSKNTSLLSTMKKELREILTFLETIHSTLFIGNS